MDTAAGDHVPESGEGVEEEAVAAKARDEEGVHGVVGGAGRAGPLEPAEDLEGVVGGGRGGAEIGGEEHEGDGGDVRVGLRGVEEVCEKGHGLCEVMLGGEGVDQRGEVEGVERGVGEEGGGGEAQRRWKLVGVAEARDQEVDPPHLFIC